MSTTLKAIIGAIIAALLLTGVAAAVAGGSHAKAATAIEYGLIE